MPKNHFKGKVIIFEGLDCSGKSTQVDLLAKYLRDKHYTYSAYKVLAIKNPDTTTTLGSTISELTKSGQVQYPETLFNLFMAGNADISRRIHEHFKEYPEGCVIIDRFIFTTFAYQCARGRITSYVIKDWLDSVGLSYSIWPYYTVSILINTPAEVILDRLSKKNLDTIEKTIDVSFIDRVANSYQILFDMSKDAITSFTRPGTPQGLLFAKKLVLSGVLPAQTLNEDIIDLLYKIFIKYKIDESVNNGVLLNARLL